jgi:NADH-quinone oxidoreductase subunit A
MTATYLPIVVMALAATALVGLFFLLSQWLGPKNITPQKAMPYESGMPTEGARHVRLNALFFTTAIIFVVFDIEAAFLFPWAAIVRQLGWFGLIEMLLFVFVLAVTLIYAMRKGAFEWEK